MRDLRVKGGHLERQLAAGVQRKARPVKDLIILTAHHIEVDQRQFSFDHAGDHMVQPRLEFAAIIGRSVGHQQKLRPGFGQRFGHIGVPCVFADRAADAGIANGVRPTQRRAVENAHLVEHGLVRQVVLEDTAGDLAVSEDQIGIIELGPFDPGRTDGQRGPISTISRQRFEVGHHIQLERLLHHQILRVIPGQEHLGQSNQIGACLFALRPGLPREVCVSGQIPDGGVQLAKRDAKTRCHRAVLR